MEEVKKREYFNLSQLQKKTLVRVLEENKELFNEKSLKELKKVTLNDFKSYCKKFLLNKKCDKTFARKLYSREYKFSYTQFHILNIFLEMQKQI